MTPQHNAQENSQETPQHTSRHEFPISDETIEKRLSPEDTLVKKPSTFDLQIPPDVKRETRYGDVFMDKKNKITLMIKGYITKTVEAEVHDHLVIGRTAAKTQARPDLDLNRYGGYISGISRKHAIITKDANVLTITDLDSKNGTYLNGVKLIPNQPRILRDGDELCLGTLFMHVSFTSTMLDTNASMNDHNK